MEMYALITFSYPPYDARNQDIKHVKLIYEGTRKFCEITVLHRIHTFT